MKSIKELVGRRQIVVPQYVKLIENELKSTIDPNQKKIMTAYLTAFKYYEQVSNMNGPFIKECINYFNQEAKYLREKFPFAYIEPQARIKSPLSADKKIRDKIKEYLRDGRDLTHITDSLRDFVGFRYVISLPELIENDDEKSIELCYQVLKAQMDFQKEHGFKFIPVSKKKQDDIKAPKKYKSNPKSKHVFIPTSRPEYIEEYDESLKDYIMNPTENLYQSAQYCVIPPWAQKPQVDDEEKTDEEELEAAIEFQIRTSKMHRFAETDEYASHKLYKQRDQQFHRLRVPFEFGYITDKDGHITDKIGQLPLDYSIQKYYGISFYDLFGIDYSQLEELPTEVQNQVYAGNYHIEMIDDQPKVVPKPRKQPTFVVIKKASEKIKFFFRYPIQSIRSSISYTKEDNEKDMFDQ